ncbi:MAG TPA: glycosyltransferase family A protein [Devosia sp.]|nr:glycosyltransferase family A protein [Devosia sp.]
MVLSYSVVIPAYNAEATLTATIGSVLAQSVPPARVIVVDDGSSDGTAGVARGFGGIVELMMQSNAGPGAATTRGLAMVDTPLTATIDADDLWTADKAKHQIAYLQEHPGTAAVFTRIANFRHPTAEPDTANAYDGWLRTTMMIRTQAAIANGPVIDPAGGAGDMVDWLARLRESGHETVMLTEILAFRRIHPGSLSDRSRNELGKSYMQVVRNTMLRRRNASR